MARKKSFIQDTQLFQANLESIPSGTKLVFHAWNGATVYIFRGIGPDERGIISVQLQKPGKKHKIIDMALHQVGITPNNTVRENYQWLESLAAFNYRQENAKPKDRQLLRQT